jgi:hypothetical protein
MARMLHHYVLQLNRLNQQKLSATLTRVGSTGLLQIHQGLLAQTPGRAECPQLQEVMQRMRKVADLKGGHEPEAAGTWI